MILENGFEQVAKASFIHPFIPHVFVGCSQSASSVLGARKANSLPRNWPRSDFRLGP